MAKKTTNPYGLTADDIKELYELADIDKMAERAAEIRKRFKAFLDDNIEALATGIELDDELRLSAKTSRRLIVERTR